MKRLIIPLSIVVAFFIAGCGNSKTSDKPKELDTSTLAEKTESMTEVKQETPPHPGKKVFDEYCTTCHQMDGSGVPGMYPPLWPNEYIENKEKIIHLVLNGLTGEIEVDGETYNNLMAPHNHLTDLELANVISYVRSSFGNELEPVTLEEIAAARQK